MGPLNNDLEGKMNEMLPHNNKPYNYFWLSIQVNLILGMRQFVCR